MEGPSIVILQEEAAKFVGKKILRASGSTKSFDATLLKNHTLREIRSWGKHFLLVVGKRTVRVHFLMFGSYRIDERKPTIKPRLSLKFKNGEINFYSCSVKLLQEAPEEVYDWRIDIMSPQWD